MGGVIGFGIAALGVNGIQRVEPGGGMKALNSGVVQVPIVIVCVGLGWAALVTIFFVPWLYRVIIKDDWQMRWYYIFYGPLLLRRGKVGPLPSNFQGRIRDFYAGHATKEDIESRGEKEGTVDHAAPSPRKFLAAPIGDKAKVPVWILIFGGVRIAIGLWTHGYRIMRNLGNKVTLHSPSRGFSMELGSAFTIVLATRLSLPVSTAQCITGATVGVGLCNRDWRAITGAWFF
ncbi:hypothetical protein EsH8_VI_001197 [Colletotrichum jinshuiense]